jgi:branched-chain amino acid transport system substrate-binding protein
LRHNLPWFSKNVAAMSAVALSVGVLAACSSSSSTSSSTGVSANSSSSKGPIVIGMSLSINGPFSADGQAFLKGYQLWQKDVNAAGGILGRQVTLKYLDDNSDPNQVVANYQTLINTDHVNLTFGPYSSKLTRPASSVAASNGYAFIEGAGGAPSVFDTPSNTADHNVFDVSLPVADELMPLVAYIQGLPASQRPKTAAYPMTDDPFSDPPVQLAQAKLQALGVKTVYASIFNADTKSYKSAANHVVAQHPDLLVLGSTDVPTLQTFMQAFEQQRYVPKLFLAASGPDQGSAFTTAVTAGNAAGIMVPNGWYPGFVNAASQRMVKEYESLYHVTESSINADVAEAYSVGQVAQQAIVATGGVDNAKIISYLHSGVTLTSVQGPVRFDSLGENGAAAAFIFQWTKNGTTLKQVLPKGKGSVQVLNPKPNWVTTG